jgi:hypothetical protein
VEPEPEKAPRSIFSCPPPSAGLELPAKDVITCLDVQHSYFMWTMNQRKDPSAVNVSRTRAFRSPTAGKRSSRSKLHSRRADEIRVRGERLPIVGHSGIDLLRQVKQIRPDLPVIIISGYGIKRRAKAMAEGASVISKHRT